MHKLSGLITVKSDSVIELPKYLIEFNVPCERALCVLSRLIKINCFVTTMYFNLRFNIA